MVLQRGSKGLRTLALLGQNRPTFDHNHSVKRKVIGLKLSQLIHSIKVYHILENWIIVPIRTRVLGAWIGWISTFGNFGVVLAKFVWGCEIPTPILSLNTNCSWSIMIHRLKPEKRLLQVIYLNLARYGRQLKSRSIYLLFSKRPTFADFSCDFESVRRLLDPHCSRAKNNGLT